VPLAHHLGHDDRTWKNMAIKSNQLDMNY
jgi:hypothetical protein